MTISFENPRDGWTRYFRSEDELLNYLENTGLLTQHEADKQ